MDRGGLKYLGGHSEANFKPMTFVTKKILKTGFHGPGVVYRDRRGDPEPLG